MRETETHARGSLRFTGIVMLRRGGSCDYRLSSSAIVPSSAILRHLVGWLYRQRGLRRRHTARPAVDPPMVASGDFRFRWRLYGLDLYLQQFGLSGGIAAS